MNDIELIIRLEQIELDVIHMREAIKEMKETVKELQADQEYRDTKQMEQKERE